MASVNDVIEMDDKKIRHNFHKKKLQRHHLHDSTLVLDELGLNHGKCRADIAVINGHLVGYEIKSDKDSLYRLEEQVKSYNDIFDKSSIIVGERYVNTIEAYIPETWGIILSAKGPRGAVTFETIRKVHINKNINPISVAKLLWKDEAAEILRQKGLPPKILRQPRAVLYELLADKLNINDLRKTVRDCLKNRKNWRCQE